MSRRGDTPMAPFADDEDDLTPDILIQRAYM